MGHVTRGGRRWILAVIVELMDTPPGRVLHLPSNSALHRRRHRSGLSHPYGAVVICWPLSYCPQGDVLLQPQNFPSPVWSQNAPDWLERHIVVQGCSPGPGIFSQRQRNLAPSAAIAGPLTAAPTCREPSSV
jgi:hypothetical protein